MKSDKVLILDFGSQYTQLIARRVRESNVYCEIVPYNADYQLGDDVKAVILSGSPMSVRLENHLVPDFDRFMGKVPVLAICYGAQLIAQTYGGTVEASDKREFGKAVINVLAPDLLFDGLGTDSQVWMSHGDSIVELPGSFTLLANTSSIPVAAYRVDTSGKPCYCLQFHPEVTHSLDGGKIMGNFLYKVAGLKGEWTPAAFVEDAVKKIQDTVGDEKVLMAISGGVDSSVAAMLVHKAIGKQLTSIFVDNGLLRREEFPQVLDTYKRLGLNVTGVDAKEEFYSNLSDEYDPEKKRKIIGNTFIDVFDREAEKIKNVVWLAQGTIYPDVIESVSVSGPSVTIKSHHNVGGLPEKMHLKVIEPLKYLFKDEVRKVGEELNLPHEILGRHPFPGPGLGIRILGSITPEKVDMLQKADDIYIQNMKDSGLYDEVWQAGAILLPVQSVGVMGDERTYEFTIALRAVDSVDGMTAEWSRLPHDFLAKVSSEIINQVKGINRVVYDISTKPPATIEWE